MCAKPTVSTPLAAETTAVAHQLHAAEKALGSLSSAEQAYVRSIADKERREMTTAKTSKAKAGKGAATRSRDVTAPPKTPAAPPTDKNQLMVRRVPGEDIDVTLVRARLHPVSNAASTIRGFEPAMAEHGFGSLVEELTRHVENVNAGSMNRPETILLMQAQTLDVIFNTLARRAAGGVGTHRDAMEVYLRMALKAQAQCRTTLETLAEIKAPKSPTFIKQQNVANQQQVNNGAAANGNGLPAHAHGKTIPNQSNELLEQQHGERLDGGAQSAAIGAHPPLEALAKVDRPENKRRKNAQ
jgi:hypothetical protein